MSTAGILVAALLLDAVFGEPKWLWDRIPHPAVLMGRIIGAADTRFNQGTRQRLHGLWVIVGLVVLAGLLGWILAELLPWWAEAILAAILLAHRSLVDHVTDVAVALRQGVEPGRKSVARIVGRDTSVLDGPGIARSAIESAAENMSDGVVAPAVFFLLFGLPGLLIYKIVNTADSMIGYRTPRHAAFGWAAARLDDVLNWGPARLTAAGIALTERRRSVWRIAQRDAGHHRSPNAGWPEAAMAAAINTPLAGPRQYDGRMTDDVFVYPEGQNTPGPEEIAQAVAVLWRVWQLGLAVVTAVALVPWGGFLLAALLTG